MGEIVIERDDALIDLFENCLVHHPSRVVAPDPTGGSHRQNFTRA
jgi:hypothetical protein